ncbi:MAG: HD domain-containing protein [Magnetococcales bacterium]|nr:HD domain-containing protein [Magnetococcales bacterium]
MAHTLGILKEKEKKKVDSSSVDAILERQLQELALEDDDKMATTADDRSSLEREIGPATKLQERFDGDVARFFKEMFAGQAVQPEPIVQGVREVMSSVLRQEQALLGLTLLKQRGGGHHVHAVNVSTLMMIFCKFLGEPVAMTELMGQAGIFHDLGVTRIPGSILEKETPLSVPEVKVLQTHVHETAGILKEMKIQEGVIQRVALEHHERLDGTGYPQRIKGTAISREGRIGAIVNDFENLTGTRPFRKPIPHHDALRRMMGMADRYYDKVLLQKFVRCVGVYPMGTILRLKNRHVVMVVGNHATHLLHPIVRVVADSSGRIVTHGQWINLVEKKEDPGYKIEGPTPPPVGLDLVTLLKKDG